MDGYSSFTLERTLGTSLTYNQRQVGTFSYHGFTMSSTISFYGVLHSSSTTSGTVSGADDTKDILLTVQNTASEAVSYTVHLDSLTMKVKRETISYSVRPDNWTWTNPSGSFSESGIAVSELTINEVPITSSSTPLSNIQDQTVTGTIIAPYSGTYTATGESAAGTILDVAYSGEAADADFPGTSTERRFSVPYSCTVQNGEATITCTPVSKTTSCTAGTLSYETSLPAGLNSTIQVYTKLYTYTS